MFEMYSENKEMFHWYYWIKGSGIIYAASLSRKTRAALKYIYRLSIKTKPKVALTLKTKTIVTLILKTNKYQHLFVIYLSLMGGVQCSLSSAISQVCTHSGASCRKTNSPTHLCCRYQAKHSKLTEEIRLLSEATTYIFPHRNRRERHESEFILFDTSS